MELSCWKVVSALLLIWALHLPVNEAEVLVEQQLPAFLLEMQSSLLDESAKAYKELLVNGSGLAGAELCFAAKLICKDVVGGHGLKQYQFDLPMWLKHGHGGKKDDLPIDFDLPMWINHKNAKGDDLPIDFDLPMWIKHKNAKEDDLPIDFDLPMWINHKNAKPIDFDLPMWINHKNAKEDDLPIDFDLPMWLKHDHVLGHSMPKAGNIDPHKYFRLSDLVSGKRIVFITTENPAPKAAFLHKNLLEVLPFSSKNLSTMLSRLGIDRRSEQANEMRATLGHCEGKTKDEVETISKCYNSLEEMIKYVNSMLGDDARVLSTNVHKGTESVMVAQVIKAGGHDAIICHVMKFPYAVYFCHRLRETETFEVSMQNEEGKIFKAMAICHMETSQFTANLGAFYMLGMAPGDGEVCHWLAHRDLVWIPNRSAL